ncbi:MAG: hypothetical protein K0V04_03495 [Deltaproteobacteria bacterium]|nr:hypothetical protein [Deltaproteobacteria bacterium]
MRCSWLASAVLASIVAAPASASALEPAAATPPTAATASPATPDENSPQAAARRHRRANRVRAVEIQGLAMTQLLPSAGFGGDAAFVFGFPGFQVRAGAQLVGVPGFRLGQGEVSNFLQAGTLDLCAAKQVLRHQIRMCVGGQAGGMAHRWKGYERPGRRITAWAAGTLKGDYQLQFTDHFGLIGGVGVVLPIVGPSFRAYDSYGSPSPLVFPGPMAGFLSLGTSFRW